MRLSAYVVTLCCWAASMAWPTLCHAVPRIGLGLPDVYVESTQGVKIRLRSFEGRPILILAESRESRNTNPELRAALRALGQDASLRQHWVMLPVAIANRYNYWPLREFTRKEIQKESLREKIEIYSDWTGQFSQALGIHEEQAAVILFDRKGHVIFGYDGKLPSFKRNLLMALLRREIYQPLDRAQVQEHVPTKSR